MDRKLVCYILSVAYDLGLKVRVHCQVTAEECHFTRIGGINPVHDDSSLATHCLFVNDGNKDENARVIFSSHACNSVRHDESGIKVWLRWSNYR